MKQTDSEANQISQPAKLIWVASEIRTAIIRGEFNGIRNLPTRRDLMKRFDTSMATVQRSMEQLEKEGFIESDGRRGTRVAESLPHLSCFGLVFSGTPDADARKPQFWSRFWDMLSKEALNTHRRRPPYRIKVFYDIHYQGDRRAHDLLLEAVERHQLAGLIFPYYIDEKFTDSPLLNRPDLPLATITPPEEGISDHASVYFDLSSWIDLALSALAEKGRKRVAWVHSLGFGQTAMGAQPYTLAGFRDLVARKARASGMETRPLWVTAVDSNNPSNAQSVVELLLSAPAGERPDAIVLADDHYAGGAIAALMGLGVKVPEEVEVVTYRNFPDAPASGVPMTAIGFDMGELLDLCIDALVGIREHPDAPKPRKTLWPRGEKAAARPPS